MHTISSLSCLQVKLDTRAASPGHRAVEELAAQSDPSVSRLELTLTKYLDLGVKVY